MKRYLFTLILVIVLSGCNSNLKSQTNNLNSQSNSTTTTSPNENDTFSQNLVEPLFKNSIVSTDIDFILDTDPDSFDSLTFIGREDKEMPDSRNNELFHKNTFVFSASFTNGKTIEIWCHSSFESQEAANEYAKKLCPRLGKLPQVQRDMLDHVVIHKGDATAFSDTESHFFILYSENMDARISTNDLEETVFHESVHASLQELYENNVEWKSVQKNDGNYITDYAKRLPQLEDMPETAIFAYTMIKYPGRLSVDTEKWINQNIPKHLDFLELYMNEFTI